MWLVVWIVASNVTLGLLAIARRPRPFGVDFQTSWGGWGGWALLQVTALTVLLMGVHAGAGGALA